MWRYLEGFKPPQKRKTPEEKATYFRDYCAIVALKTEMVHANSLSAPKWRRKLTYGPWNLHIVRPWSGSLTQI
jgi:hypothetical protein